MFCRLDQILKTRNVLCAATWLVLSMHAASLATAEDSRAKFGSLTEEVAERWSKLVLANIDIEFPNKMSLVYTGPDQIKTPKANFPAFYGCFDWHSSVHGHWVLVQLLKDFPDLETAPNVRDRLNEHLSRANLLQEAAFFAKAEHKSFERMYGWAWLLRLVIELDNWQDADGQRWRKNLVPLEDILVDRLADYLPKLSYPIRVGQHTDTSFALAQVLDYARATENEALADLVVTTAKRFYLEDKDYPVHYEPSGHDFFSSCWNEADLMRRILPEPEFAEWLGEFLPEVEQQLTDGTIAPVEVTDVTDGKLVHLAGLNLNRAWCLQSVAAALSSEHPLVDPLRTSAERHLSAGVDYVNSGHYAGDHWLATFALYAIVESERK